MASSATVNEISLGMPRDSVIEVLNLPNTPSSSDILHSPDIGASPGIAVTFGPSGCVISVQNGSNAHIPGLPPMRCGQSVGQIQNSFECKKVGENFLLAEKYNMHFEVLSGKVVKIGLGRPTILSPMPPLED